MIENHLTIDPVIRQEKPKLIFTPIEKKRPCGCSKYEHCQKCEEERL